MYLEEVALFQAHIMDITEVTTIPMFITVDKCQRGHQLLLIQILLCQLLLHQLLLVQVQMHQQAQLILVVQDNPYGQREFVHNVHHTQELKTTLLFVHMMLVRRVRLKLRVDYVKPAH